MIKGKEVSRGSTLSIAIGTLMFSIILLSGGASALDGGMTWHVFAGGETPDMAIQGLGFYPGNITINEGDSINWTLGGHLVHTVSFLSGAPVPDPGNPKVLLPAGGSTYNGTGIVSSGLLLPGMSYNLTFTKTGFYDYRCLIHPGMAGVVIVQPAGSPYPANQAQYTAQGMKELQADINTGQKLANNLSLTTTPGTNGTTVFHASADIPLPLDARALLFPKNNFNVTGTATLNFIDVGKLQVQVMVSGLVPNSIHPAHIHIGTSAAGGPIVYPLTNVTADANGRGTSTTVITGPPWFAIASSGWFINVHQGPTMEGSGATPISSGDIVKHDAMLARFTPENLTIHAGDQVEWTELNSMEIHTVTFPEAGKEPPEFLLPNLTDNPVAAMPAGGSVHNGTGFYNSGILNPGDKYTLTFTKPGTYDYVCVVHDNMNMVGKVIVLPPGGTISGTKFNDANGNQIRDLGEKGLANWTIKLIGFDRRTMKAVKQSAVTDADGSYIFTDLSPGQYTLTEKLQPGWVPTTPPARSISLGEGESAQVDFGNRKVIQQSTSDVNWFSNGTVIPGASSKLLRTNEGATMELHTSELNASDAVTVWWVVFNKPENCTQGHFGLRCGPGDLGDPSTQASVMFAAGSVSSANGKANFGGHLAVGDTKGCSSGLPCDGGLTSPMGADIHLVVRDHGSIIPSMLHEQLSTFNGGCNPGEPNAGKCMNVQYSAHESVDS